MIYMELNILILHNLLKFPIVLQHFNSFIIMFQIIGPRTLTEKVGELGGGKWSAFLGDK